MRFRIRPIEAGFFRLFNESAAHLVTGAELLAQTLEADADLDALAARMHELEHQADETTHRIIGLVNKTFVTPYDREDIYALAGGLDDVMDFMDATVDSISLFGIESFPADFAAQVGVLQRAAQVTADAMPRLRAMEDLSEYWIEINRLENEGDHNHRRLLATLFSGSFKTLDVLKLKDIVESVESAIDALEKVANTVEQIVVKES